jgi:hypothetical protein
LAISLKVTGASMRIDTAVESSEVFESPGKYGRIAWAQRSASRGEVEVAGIGKSPPVQSHGYQYGSSNVSRNRTDQVGQLKHLACNVFRT